MTPLQDLIHKIEVSGGMRPLRYVLAFLLAALLLLAYNLRVSKNMSAQEAMDTAQLGRNISEGNGYTTLFVRPFSMYLVMERKRQKLGLPDARNLADYSQIRQAHPDIVNPPVYPVVLAGLMKVLPFDYQISKTKAYWSSNGHFWRYEPDYLIAWFNQALFLVIILVTYFWARRVFDVMVARTAAIFLFASELLWDFSTSGLSTMLLILIFVGLVWCLTLLEKQGSEKPDMAGGSYLLSVATGLLTALGGLTRYGFAWLIVPVFLFLILFAGPRKVRLSLIALGVFVAAMAPWLVRNYLVSGTPFGTATFSILEGDNVFSGYQLQRSLDPDLQIFMRPLWNKILLSTRQILQNDLFNLGGGWMMIFFLVGLMVGFRSATIRRVRYFVVAGLGVLFVVQALGRTQLTDDSPRINSENFLVLLLPFVVVYAVSFFYLLLDQIHFPTRHWRYLVVGGLGVLIYLPLISSLFLPRNIPINYPPYYPPAIRQASDLLKTNELMMSDVPWAVAWYGNRQCVWLTLNALQDPSNLESRENFFTINDFQKPISGLYLTPKTLDLHFQSELIRAGNYSWGTFILNTLLHKEVPSPFPLGKIAPDYLPEQMFLSDWERWRKAE
jgi:hypothetical protein